MARSHPWTIVATHVPRGATRPTSAPRGLSRPRSPRPSRPRQLASRPARLTARSRRSASGRDRRADDQQRLVAPHQPGRVVGHERAPVADDQHDGGVLGQPQLRQVDAVQPGARRHRHLHQVGVELVQRRGLDRRRRGASTAWRCPAGGPPRAATSPARAVKTTTSTNTVSKMNVAPGTSAVSGKVASTIGTAPRSPAQEMNTCWGHGNAEPGQAGDHRQRSGDQQQRAADQQRRPDRVGQPVRARPAGPAARTGRSGRARPCPRRSRCWPPGAAAWRCRAPARRGRPRRSPTCAAGPRRRRPARRGRGWPAGRSRPAGAPSGAAARRRRTRSPAR